MFSIVSFVALVSCFLWIHILFTYLPVVWSIHLETQIKDACSCTPPPGLPHQSNRVEYLNNGARGRRQDECWSEFIGVDRLQAVV